MTRHVAPTTIHASRPAGLDMLPGQIDMFALLEPAPAAPPADAVPVLPDVGPLDPRPFYLDGDRPLPQGWAARARANIEAIRLSARLAASGRPASPEEQARLALFTGFGASDLANNAFRRPGETGFRSGWEEIGRGLEGATSAEEYAALARATQYAHYTPERIVRALWAGVERIGFRGGAVLEPGIGPGLIACLTPPALREAARFVGIEADPVAARIAALLQPGAEIRVEDFGTTRLRPRFALAIGNPPYSARVVRTDPAYRALAPRLHDFFLVKACDLLLPGGVAAFVTSQGTMDKVDASVRRHVADGCDLLGAIRLPQGTFAATAGTEVGVDVLFLRRRQAGEGDNGVAWTETEALDLAGLPGQRVNAYWLDNPDMVLGRHGVGTNPYGGGPAYVCLSTGQDLDAALAGAIAALPEGVCDCASDDAAEAPAAAVAIASGANARLREGSYFVAPDDALMQVLDGRPQTVAIKSGKGAVGGIFPKHARIIRDLIPIRDAVREILSLQEQHANAAPAQADLNRLYDAFVKRHGFLNLTSISTREGDNPDDPRSETHRQLNLAPFRDDPDCWLVASIEEYDIETHQGTKGLIFSGTVMASPPEPQIRSAGDALARSLHETGGVDLEAMAAMLGRTEAEVVADLGPAIYRNPATLLWETADEYLSGRVRDKLALAEAAAARDEAFAANVVALEAVQPTDIPPSDITARLGAPWMPTDVVAAFIKEQVGVRTEVRHLVEAAAWALEEYRFLYAPSADRQWGTHRYGVYKLLLDALNARIPAVYDETWNDNGNKTRELNVTETEAAKEKLAALKTAFERWVWQDPARADRLSRLYNDAYNDLVARRFDGAHLTLPGAAATFSFRKHQKDAIWRMVCGGTYVAHAVGAGKTATIAGAIIEQRRLGLVGKAILTVPGHCLAQCAREFLAIYPLAKILVADETNFAKDKRRRFLARAATGDWDAIIITHSAFKFITLPTHFERAMMQDLVDNYAALIADVDKSDRLTVKKLERRKEDFEARLKALELRRDDFLTLGEIGVDQIIVDEAHEFRRLAFVTNTTSLKGIDSDGSQMAWDLYAKATYLRAQRRLHTAEARHGIDRALHMASGTPITNTVGEMFTLQRFMAPEALEERGLQEFDAWAATFGETRTELELQPTGRYKPVTRFAEFVNVPELIAMFRAFADVVSAEDLRALVKRPAILGGKRQIITAAPGPGFRDYQKVLEARIRAIEIRKGKPNPGDDIILSVINDGRHAAMDLRFVDPTLPNDPGAKINLLVAKVHEIYREGAEQVYLQPDGSAYDRRGSTQMIFSDLGTLTAERTRGFSAYRWIKAQLVALGVPADEIAFVQDYKGSQAKNRLFHDMRAGKIRITLGSTKKMGTGVNAQNRMAALHHLDVPWIPSDIEQREGRIDRQGNQNAVIGLYAYATEGSMDATMWQANERKARFIAAALSGDRSVRRLEDIGEGSVNQFAMAKAIASGDPRLMQKAGLEAEIARMERLRAQHYDEQHVLRRRVHYAEQAIEKWTKVEAVNTAALARRTPADAPFVFTVRGVDYTDATEAGRALVRTMRDLEHGLLNGRQASAEIAGEPIAEFRGFRVLHSVTLRGQDVQTETEVEIGEGAHEAIRGRSNTPGKILVEQIGEEIAGTENRIRRAQAEIADARTVIATCQPLVGRSFDLQGELEAKRAALFEIEATLAATDDDASDRVMARAA